MNVCTSPWSSAAISLRALAAACVSLAPEVVSARSLGDAGDVLGYLARTPLGRVRNVAADLVRGGGLLFHRRSDGVRNIVDLVDDGADLRDGLHRALGVALDGFDLLADLFGGFGGLLGQFFHFVGHHRESLARFAGARGFDGGVQRQQIGLLRDGGDDLDYLADLDAGFAQLA